ncbi:hypothetical protein HDU67_000141 [Dinochytrium kinnereticum]|nr:hypothetical protein HDU67_000141 [Dinochytrium kinnereticum]
MQQGGHHRWSTAPRPSIYAAETPPPVPSLPLELIARILSLAATSLHSLTTLSLLNRSIHSLITSSPTSKLDLLLARYGRRGAFLHLSEILRFPDAESTVQLLCRKGCALKCPEIGRSNIASFKGGAGNLLVHDWQSCPFMAISRSSRGCKVDEDGLCRILAAMMKAGMDMESHNRMGVYQEFRKEIERHIVDAGNGKLLLALPPIARDGATVGDGSPEPPLLVKTAIDKGLLPIIRFESRRRRRRWGSRKILEIIVQSRDITFLEEYLSFDLETCQFRDPKERARAVSSQTLTASPLRIAIEMGDVEAVRVLFSHGFAIGGDVDKIVISSQTPGALAALMEKGWTPTQPILLSSIPSSPLSVIKHLIAISPPSFISSIVFTKSIHFGRSDLIRHLVQSFPTCRPIGSLTEAVTAVLTFLLSPNLSPAGPCLSDFLETVRILASFEAPTEAIMRAACQPHSCVELIEILLDNGGIFCDACCMMAPRSDMFESLFQILEPSWETLYYGCLRRYESIVEKSLHLFIPIDAWHISAAALSGSICILQTILSSCSPTVFSRFQKNSSPNPDLSSPNRHVKAPNPLLSLVRLGNHRAVSMLLDAGLKAAKRDKEFVMAAVESGCGEMVRVIVHEGFDVDPRTVDVACQRRFSGILQILLEDARIEPAQYHLSLVLKGRLPSGSRPDDDATSECIKLLIRNSSKRNRVIVPRDVILAAVSEDRVKVATTLIQESDNEIMVRLEDALPMACRSGNAEMVSMLLRNGIRPKGGAFSFCSSGSVSDGAYRIQDIISTERVGVALFRNRAIQLTPTALEAFAKMGYASLVKATLRRGIKVDSTASLAQAGTRAVLDLLIDSLKGEGWGKMSWRQFSTHVMSLEVARRLLVGGWVEVPKYGAVAMPFLNGHVVVAQAYDELLYGS